MRFIVGFGRFWWDFIIGDDWKLAAGVAVVLVVGGTLTGETHLSNVALTLLVGAGIVLVVSTSIIAGAYAAHRKN
ncbi:MAG TPA: hypothetical protein VGJ81_09460 [Thermoanaerobaculia bacterium]|jgi:hypothetical protein